MGALVTMANERFFADFISTDTDDITVYDLSCLYWVYGSMGDQGWDPVLVEHMERHLCRCINHEIVLQKKFERERDDRTDSGL